MSSRLEGLLKLYEKEPDEPFISYGIALEYISLKEFQKAEEFLSQTIEKDPGYTAAYMQYALLKTDLNKTDEAKQLFKKGIEAAYKSGDKRSAKEMEDFLEDLE